MFVFCDLLYNVILIRIKMFNMDICLGVVFCVFLKYLYVFGLEWYSYLCENLKYLLWVYMKSLSDIGIINENFIDFLKLLM